MHNAKLEAYKNFYNKGIWDTEILNNLKFSNFLSQEEYNSIVNQPKKAPDTRINSAPYIYEIWDKKTPINGVPAEEMLKDNTLKNASNVILIKSPNADDNNIVHVESVDVLKINNRLRSNLTATEVGEYQIDLLEEMRNTPQINYDELNTATEIYSKAIEQKQLSEIHNLLTDIKQLLLKISDK